jgi:hypothetical protein
MDVDASVRGRRVDQFEERRPGGAVHEINRACLYVMLDVHFDDGDARSGRPQHSGIANGCRRIPADVEGIMRLRQPRCG